jgi:uncharacterized protein YdaU (DUF1376 family)
MANSWFPHDSSALKDEKIIVLRKRHGIYGIGIYWLLVEICYENKGSINAYKIPIIFEAYDVENGNEILSTMCELRLFNKEDEMYTSDRIKREIEIMRQQSEKKVAAGRAGGLAKASNAKHVPSPAKQTLAKRSTLHNNTIHNRTEPTTSMSADADVQPKEEIADELETFVSWLNERQIFPNHKIITVAVRRQWAARRKNYSERELAQAFANLSNEPDRWKLEHNGSRPLAWWLKTDERIEDMKACHLKKGKGEMIFAG